MKLKQRTRTDLIVVHCSATPPSADVGVKEIDAWHRARGFLKIGYHFVIRRDGIVEPGRNTGDVGAHAEGFNSTSVGVCLVGGVDAKNKAEDNFTPRQYIALQCLLTTLKREYSNAEIVGHRDLSPDKDGDGVVEPHEWLKECPSFDVKKWLAGNRLLD